MAIVKGNYTRSRAKIKASVRYISHRPTLAGERLTRTLFGQEGAIDKEQVYQMIDRALRGTVFFRLVISPDPKREDTRRDLDLQAITRKTVFALEERLNRRIQFIAAEHNDHSDIRHVHAIVMVRLAKGERLSARDYKLLREAATNSALYQRRALDHTRGRALNRHYLNRAFSYSTPYYSKTSKSEVQTAKSRGGRVQPPRLSCPDCGYMQPMYRLKSGIHWCPSCHLKLNHDREQIRQIQL